MGFYDDLYLGNSYGYHYFDGDLGPAFSISNPRPHPDGELCDIGLPGPNTITDVLLHRNGRDGERDLSQDTWVIPVAKLISLSDGNQAVMYAKERVPGESGRRPAL